MNSSDRSSDTCVDKRHKCLVEGCNVSYAKRSFLEVHRRKHNGERPFKCDISGCSKAYTNQAHLRRHKCSVHEQLSEIICTVKGCGLVLNNKYSLKKHCSRVHNPANYAFACSECSQGFQKKWQLNEHFYLHTGEVPYKCTRCNIGFATLHNYNKHKKNHKTYTCDCSATFERWSLFCAHRRNSCTIKKIDHKCVICNKVFTTQTNLRQHSFIHVKESQKDIYRCSYINCNRSYQYKKNLDYHIAAFHERLKGVQIKCTEPGCQQVLKSKKNLKQHIWNIHVNVPKEKKERKPRKDKGKPKKCMTSIMSGIPLPLEEHLAVINDSTVNSAINVNIDRKPLKPNLFELDENKKHRKTIEKIKIEKIDSNNLSNNDLNIVTESCRGLGTNSFSDKLFIKSDEKLREKFVEILGRELRIKKVLITMMLPSVATL